VDVRLKLDTHLLLMPEGDSLHRAALRLQPLVGRCVEASAPHPRGRATGVAAAVDGRRLESVEAVGKHLLLRFEGRVTVRSHLRMNGRWRVGAACAVGSGRPWLVLRAGEIEATQWNGPVLTLDLGPLRRLGPDLLAEGSDPAALVPLLRRTDPGRPLGEVLQDQRLVAGIGNRIRVVRRVSEDVAVRAPHLRHVLRGFTLGAFAYLLRELDEGAELPVAFVEHEHAGGPALYEYRPLVRAFVEERAPRLRMRDDALIALEELQREPAAAIFARAHAGPRPSEEEALFRTVLLGLLVSTAEACGGFDWDDASFDRAYAELERSLFGERRAYAAVAPLVGISVATQLELAPGLRVRAVAEGELARHWPEAGSLVPKDFGRETDRYCVLELRAALQAAEDPPDAPAELADAVSAIRLATAAPLSAGPVLFETLDGRPFGIRPVLPIAATQPPGEATRLDSFRAALAAELLARLGLADGDGALAEALDRWELSLFQNEPFRSDQLRAAFAALLGETCLLEAEPAARAELHAGLGELAAGGAAATPVADAVRGALVEVLRHGDRPALLLELDETLLGVRDRRVLRLAG
jgi:hypothetical protein